MKLKKSKLRKIISEELVRVLMEKESKRILDLKEGQETPKAVKAALQEVARCTSTLKNATLSPWLQAKVLKATRYLQEVKGHIQKEMLFEEMADPSATTLRADSDYQTTDTLGLMDPHSIDANEDSWFNNVQVASRILEDLPLSDLPEQVTSAARMLRDTLDVMTNPLVQEEEDSI